MNEDYLWDKSGEPDPEIVELERKLSRLGYKPSAHPLRLPPEATALPWYRKNFTPMMAIAATLVMLLLAGGLWLGLRRSTSVGDGSKVIAETTPGVNQNLADASGPRPPIGPVDTTPPNTVSKDRLPDSSTSSATPRSRFINRAAIARQREQIAVRASVERARARREQQLAREGEAAKAQLIKALHITSDALNAVQKKIQSESEQERRPIS